MRVGMKNKNLLESMVDAAIERNRLTEITQLIKEYDALDSILIENKSYDRDVQIVVRLDELGVFDDIINEIGARGGPRGAGKDVSRPSKPAAKLGSRRGTDTPNLSQIQGVVTEPSMISRLLGAGRAGVARLGNMLKSAAKSGKTALVSKLKAAINKVRGKKPDAPVSDVPGMPQDVAAQVDATPTQASAEPEGEPDLFGGTSTPEPTQGDTTEPEAPTSTPSDPDQTNLDFDTPAEEPKAEPVAPEAPAPKEPKNTFDPKERDRLQTLAGIEPEEPAAEPVAPEAPAPEEPKAEPVASTPTTPAVEKPTKQKTSKSKVSATEKPEAPSTDTPGTEKKPEPIATTEPPKAEPVKPSADVPASDEPKRLIPKAQPTPEPDEPKRLIPKSEPTAAKPKEPEKTPEPEKPVQPWSAQGRERRAKELAAMSPEERQRERERSTRRMGLRPEPRGVGDRLKSAWRAFTAKPGDSVDIKQGYRSVFAEIERLMEQLYMVEQMLSTESVQEELIGGQKKLDMDNDGKLTAADFAKLRNLRKEIRSALVEQMIREELYSHNTTLAELNSNQRAALLETVKMRSNKMWKQLSEMRIS